VRSVPPARAVFIAITVGVLAFAGRTLLVGPPPLWLALAVLFAYLAIVSIAVTQLRLQVFVDALISGPPGQKTIALTFDDGPDPTSTPKILDALDTAGAKATFFVIGRKVKNHPELAKSILERGHAIGLHSYSHDRMMSFWLASAWRSDLSRGIRAIKKATGVEPKLFRPPIGHTNPQAARVIRELGLRTIGWSVSGHDGVRADPDDVVSRIEAALHDGAIVLLHDAAELGDHAPASVLALPRVLELVRARGFSIGDLKSWL
jgi:peptidoglycan/xylan/chitin deacetylase (PgdA/CDA1 family)